MGKEQDIELLHQFIEVEEAELLAGTPNNHWYARNWHRVDGPIKKAHRLLDERTLRKLYFHSLRRGILPGKEIIKHYPIFMEAYRDQVGFLDKIHYDYTFSSIESMMGLFVFGFNNNQVIQANQDFETYITLRGAWAKVNQYVAIPSFIEKKEKLRPFAEDAVIIERIEMTFRMLHFYHHPEGAHPSQKPEHYNYTYLPFWGLISLLVIAGSPVIEEFKKATYLPLYDKQMEILSRFK